MKKDKSLTVRLPQNLYDEIVKITINESQKQNKIIKVSETIRLILENQINNG